MENAIVERTAGVPAITYTPEQLALIKRVYAKDATDDELALFVYAAKRLRLDIMARQIHFTKRQGKPVFIVAIDGYRLNAERTGQYAPGKEPSFTYKENGEVLSATAYVKKFIGGEWHEVAATAFMDEYRPSDDGSAFMWKKMPHNQLAKCAEALVLRRAFPNELGDTITEDEAAQQREPGASKTTIREPEAIPTTATNESSASGVNSGVLIASVRKLKSGTSDKGEWNLWLVTDAAGVEYKTFDDSSAALAKTAHEQKKGVKIESVAGPKGNDLKSIVMVGESA